MLKDRTILIRNIYYMLTYAFEALKQSSYDDIAAESFENVVDLFCAILGRGISQQLKRGLYREYVPHHDDLMVLRGKLNLEGTIDLRLHRSRRLACNFDEFSQNNPLNQILKTTALLLLKKTRPNSDHHQQLKKCMLFFGDIESTDPSSIRWSLLNYRKNNQSYRMLMNICYFVLNDLLLTTEKGEYTLANFLDDLHMSRLYERFVREYYLHHHPELKPRAAHIDWLLEDTIEADALSSLPAMKTDITLSQGEKTLIIDTKYYVHTMQRNPLYDIRTYHSNNLYQIFSYVKNKDIGRSGLVSGLLLYAQTEGEGAKLSDFNMSGNRIGVRTLDLSRPFDEIQRQLELIVEDYLG